MNNPKEVSPMVSALQAATVIVQQQEVEKQKQLEEAAHRLLEALFHDAPELNSARGIIAANEGVLGVKIGNNFNFPSGKGPHFRSHQVIQKDGCKATVFDHLMYAAANSHFGYEGNRAVKPEAVRLLLQYGEQINDFLPAIRTEEDVKLFAAVIEQVVARAHQYDKKELVRNLFGYNDFDSLRITLSKFEDKEAVADGKRALNHLAELVLGLKSVELEPAASSIAPLNMLRDRETLLHVAVYATKQGETSETFWDVFRPIEKLAGKEVAKPIGYAILTARNNSANLTPRELAEAIGNRDAARLLGEMEGRFRPELAVEGVNLQADGALGPLVGRE